MDYELMLLMKPLTNEDIKERIYPKIEKLVKGLEGDIQIKDQIGKRLLAYEIKSFKEGYYLLCELTLNSSKVKELERELTLINEVLRFINIKKNNL